MIEQHAHWPEVMEQLAAIQRAKQGGSRLVLGNHVETCVAPALREGRTADAVNHPRTALRYGPGPGRAAQPRSAPPGPARSSASPGRSARGRTVAGSH